MPTIPRVEGYNMFVSNDNVYMEAWQILQTLYILAIK